MAKVPPTGATAHGVPPPATAGADAETAAKTGLLPPSAGPRPRRRPAPTKADAAPPLAASVLEDAAGPVGPAAVPSAAPTVITGPARARLTAGPPARLPDAPDAPPPVALPNRRPLPLAAVPTRVPVVPKASTVKAGVAADAAEAVVVPPAPALVSGAALAPTPTVPVRAQLLEVVPRLKLGHGGPPELAAVLPSVAAADAHVPVAVQLRRPVRLVETTLGAPRTLQLLAGPVTGRASPNAYFDNSGPVLKAEPARKGARPQPFLIYNDLLISECRRVLSPGSRPRSFLDG